MLSADPCRRLTVALIGNPNTGKSTLFGALVGVRQRVGNYPGVTVEKKTGSLDFQSLRYEIVDLPGLYSLVPRSRDEAVAVDLLMGRCQGSAPVDAVICIVDASNLERNLYLASQVIELGLPTVLALNMLDVAADQGISLDDRRLERQLGIPVVRIQANRRMGIAELKAALARTIDCPSARVDPPASGEDIQARYDWVRRTLEGVVTQPARHHETATDRLDRVLTHRFWGTLIFAAVMTAVFQAVYGWAEPLTDGIDHGMTLLAGLVESRLDAGALRSLLVDGAIRGAGGVLAFLPQIMILFAFLGILEDCGYMARAAFLMDRWMSRIGLSGKSFIPLLSSFACAIPGIMSARVIENERDRLATILAAPLMTCSARLPVYALMIAAFIPREAFLGGLLNLQGITLVALYLLGILTAIGVVLVLKKTLLRSQAPPFLMELPSYQWPSPRAILYRVVERAWLFVRCAGTLILAVSIVVWAAMYYPHRAEIVEAPFSSQKERLEADLLRLSPESAERAEAARQLERLHHEIAGEYQRQSLLGRVGRVIEPVFRPLGWDWRIGTAVIASFPARETVVATLGVVFSLPEDAPPKDEEGLTQLQSSLRRATWEGTDRRLFNVPVAVSIMVFYALCAQCAATLAVIRRETNSWRWPIFAFSYMTALAYLGALAAYRVGAWLGA